MTAKTSFSRIPASGTALTVLGVTHIYKATAAETAGQFSLLEAIVPPGMATPAHTHSKEDESFYVLSGELLIESDRGAPPLRLGPGGFFFGARGERHAFRNAGNTSARVLVLTTPACGLDDMFAEFAASDQDGMPDPRALVAIAAKYGVALEPPGA